MITLISVLVFAFLACYGFCSLVVKLIPIRKKGEKIVK
jgi:hypothetical protein